MRARRLPRSSPVALVRADARSCSHPLFSDLPKPVLAALIIDAVVFGMIDVRELRRLERVNACRLRDRRRRPSSASCRSACSPASSSASRCRSAGWCTSPRRRRYRCSAVSGAPRRSASSTSIRMTRRCRRHRRPAPRRRAVLRDGRRAARAAYAACRWSGRPRAARWCSTSAAWTSSTARARRRSPSSHVLAANGVPLHLAGVKPRVGACWMRTARRPPRTETVHGAQRHRASRTRP